MPVLGVEAKTAMGNVVLGVGPGTWPCLLDEETRRVENRSICCVPLTIGGGYY